jgi:hypothetical protein
MFNPPLKPSHLIHLAGLCFIQKSRTKSEQFPSPFAWELLAIRTAFSRKWGDRTSVSTILPMFEQRLSLFYEEHFLRCLKSFSFKAKQIYTTGNLNACLISAIPFGEVTAGRQFFVDQSRYFLTEHVIDS